MENSRSRGAVLPRWRAFLVQYGADASLERGQVRGRVEHVESGRGTRFASQQELDAFVCELLREPEDGRRGSEEGE